MWKSGLSLAWKEYSQLKVKIHQNSVQAKAEFFKWYMVLYI